MSDQNIDGQHHIQRDEGDVDLEIEKHNARLASARERFFTAPNARGEVEAIHAAVIGLAVEIEKHAKPGRNKSIALTALEDVQIRAIRSLYATGPSA